jgi:hypothetical protein
MRGRSPNGDGPSPRRYDSRLASGVVDVRTISAGLVLYSSLLWRMLLVVASGGDRGCTHLAPSPNSLANWILIGAALCVVKMDVIFDAPMRGVVLLCCLGGVCVCVVKLSWGRNNEL